MSAGDLRKQYASELLDSISQTNYPSTALLQRFEAAVGDTDALERYIELLMSRARGRFPNLQLLDRINALIGVLERAEQISAA